MARETGRWQPSAGRRWDSGGGIQAVVLASELIDELATKANALADEEEAQELKKAA